MGEDISRRSLSFEPLSLRGCPQLIVCVSGVCSFDFGLNCSVFGGSYPKISSGLDVCFFSPSGLTTYQREAMLLCK